MTVLNTLRKVTRRFGYDLMSVERADEFCFTGRVPYITERQNKIIETCRPFTQTSKERMFALIRSVEYLVKNGIPGSFTECGVWKGGSVMAMAMTLEDCRTGRDLYLFDTFSGMPSGYPIDVDLDGNDESWYRKHSDQYMHYGKGKNWNAASLNEVQANIGSLGLTKQQFHYVQGKVEQTIPQSAPEKIALLRLDTDFYASTKHELIHLFPRLSKGGVLIVDDYGHFLGARQAVDEYFEENNIKILMNRIDYTGILGVKI